MIGTGPAQTAIALTIAGSDPSGGAGIQADLKTFTALGVYGASVITALTAQNTCGVTDVLNVTPGFIEAQLDAVASDLAIGAVKTGMLAGKPTLEAVAGRLKRYKLAPLVVDPVMVATSGDVLLAPDAIDLIKTDLIPLADLITPNLHEAAQLLDMPPAEDERAMTEQGERLLALGAKAVLIKGGHGTQDEAVDLLISQTGVQRLARPRIETPHTHGTGCTMAAAITAELAKGRELSPAVARAKAFVWAALSAGQTLGVGRGAGPVDHLFALRTQEWGK